MKIEPREVISGVFAPCLICGKQAKKKGRYWRGTCGIKECVIQLRNKNSRKESSRSRYINPDDPIPVCIICGGTVPKCNDRNSWKYTCSRKCADIKGKQTLSKIGPDGKTGYQLRNEKMMITILSNDPDAFKKIAIKRDATLSLIDENGITGYQRRGRAIILSCIENGNLDARTEKIRQIALSKKTQEERASLKHYRNRVYSLSRKNDLSDLPYFYLWGHKGGYQMDHKYSVYEGYKNNIPPEIISKKENIQFIPSKSNRRKSASCSITLEELLSC